jgi:hypothetical protein
MTILRQVRMMLPCGVVVDQSWTSAQDLNTANGCSWPNADVALPTMDCSNVRFRPKADI